jgi:hypothetical protein
MELLTVSVETIDHSETCPSANENSQNYKMVSIAKYNLFTTDLKSLCPCAAHIAHSTKTKKRPAGSVTPGAARVPEGLDG